jgi:catechol 2,3-dioxygenase-like lactoylglutathione lyase family enzyme
MALKLHHTAVVVRDLDASLRFYQDGLGMQLLRDNTPEGDWPTLFGAKDRTLRSVFLGDPNDPTSGFVELVMFDGFDAPPPPPPQHPEVGFFLISFYVDLDEVGPRLASLGYPLLREIVLDSGNGAGTRMATVRDPDGVLVELITLVPDRRLPNAGE